MKIIKQLIQEEKPNQIISVGDVVTLNLIKSQIPIKVMIIDGRAQRRSAQPIKVKTQKTLYLKNPPGTITSDAWTIVQQAFEQSKTTKVFVDGEEDLLTLVAVIRAPANSIVIYGQPKEGVVAIKVTTQTKKRMLKIIDLMHPAFEKPK